MVQWCRAPGDERRADHVAFEDPEHRTLPLNNWDYCLEGEICWSDIDMHGDVDTADLLSLLGAPWGECGIGGGQIPQTVQDCINRFGFDPVALEACIQGVTGELD
jgi:hypothetical protein